MYERYRYFVNCAGSLLVALSTVIVEIQKVGPEGWREGESDEGSTLRHFILSPEIETRSYRLPKKERRSKGAEKDERGAQESG